MSGLEIGDEVYDFISGCQFRIVMEPDIGRGVMYVGKYNKKNSAVLSKTPIPPNTKICYFSGEMIVNEDSMSNLDDLSVLRSKEEYEKTLESWKNEYTIEYKPDMILVPRADSPREIDNVAFLVNDGGDMQKCNCTIWRSPKHYSIAWKSLKTIHPGTILKGFYE